MEEVDGQCADAADGRIVVQVDCYSNHCGGLDLRAQARRRLMVAMSSSDVPHACFEDLLARCGGHFAGR